MTIFNIKLPKKNKVPVIISSPHSGTYFPEEVKTQLKPEVLENPDDTDWFIDKLYDFAPNMGITFIAANYNRWVIDLNRNPESKPLYTDGRVITGLVPTTNFNGDSLYIDKEPSEDEIERRLKTYYQPYHHKLAELINEIKNEFGKVLLFDAHSIRDLVPGIRQEAFPQLILGDNDETTASKDIINTAMDTLGKGPYQLEHNYPFKGGYITRHFGNPKENIHALQLEMCKSNYMDDTQTKYNKEKANTMRTLLQTLFSNLIEHLN